MSEQYGTPSPLVPRFTAVDMQLVQNENRGLKSRAELADRYEKAIKRAIGELSGIDEQDKSMAERQMEGFLKEALQTGEGKEFKGKGL